MLSNYDESELIRSSLELGAKQYLVKVNRDPRASPLSSPAEIGFWCTSPPNELVLELPASLRRAGGRQTGSAV